MIRTVRTAAASLFAAAALALGAAPALAADLPNENWTCQNPAGNVVNGQCNGEALVAVNPGGNVPPGQNG